MRAPWWPLLVGCVLASNAATAQTDLDFAAATSRVQRWADLLHRHPESVEWQDDGRALLVVDRRDGKEQFVRIDCRSGERTVIADAAAAMGPGAPLPAAKGRLRSRDGGTATTIVFENGTAAPLLVQWIDRAGEVHDYGRLQPGDRREQNTFRGHAWRLVHDGGAIAGAWFADRRGGIARAADATPSESPTARPAAPRVFVRAFDVWCRDANGDVRLSTDGRRGDRYRDDLHLSPDGNTLLAFAEEPEQEHPLTLVEAGPPSKVHTVQYLRPGDRIARPRPRLFDLRTHRAIVVDETPFATAWSIDHVHWARDSGEVFVLYNRRGHGQLAIRGIRAATGAVRTIVDERSATFVDYSQKTMLHWLDDRGELLWASERSGDNHLLRVDVATGAATAITHGDWRVRAVELVDPVRREVWITALGFHRDQDPYHRHLLRVPLDGGEPIAITQSDGDHTWEIAPDREHAIVRWSRIDRPTVTELRRCTDGALVAELGRDDDGDLLAAGFRHAERFVAAGRDGTTAIHGIAIRPSTVEPGSKLPVLEHVYAGPQDFFAPKHFDLLLRLRALAELGFVVVQSDGMGTNWRSRAFHDVCWQNLADAGFPDRIAWLRALAARHAEIDLERVGIFGGSAGGQNAAAALIWHHDFYRAAAADCGCHDNRMDKIWWNEAWMGWPVGEHYAASSNIEHAAQLQGRLLLTVGEADRNVDPVSTLRFADALRAAGKEFELIVAPGANHGAGEGKELARRRAEFFVHALQAGR